MSTTGLLRSSLEEEEEMHTTGESRVCPLSSGGNAFVSWIEARQSSWGEDRAASGTVRLIEESGSEMRAPEGATIAYLENGELGQSCVSRVPADLGLMLPPVEEEEEEERSGLAKLSTGLLLGRRTMGCS